MLKNKKNVRKVRNILVALIAIIMILGVFIKMIQLETIEIKTIGIENIKHMKAGITNKTIDMGYGTINPIYRPEWEKISSSFDAGSKTVTVKVKGAAYRETQNID